MIGEITSRVKLTNMDDFLEDSVYSGEKFILLLKNFSFGFKDSGMMFWDLESKVVNVGDYMVSQNFASILKSLFEKYGDISANSSLNPRTKTRLFNIFCGVAYSMCNTKVTTNLLFYWWKHFKLVHHAGFNIQFAFDNLYRLAQSWFRLYQEFQTDKTLFSYHAQISDLTSKLEELKVEQKQHAASKKGKSLPDMLRWS